MPINGNGAYVNPQWVNNSEPYINANELNAISNTLQQVPIANGGTGATTAAQALTNLGAEPKANVTSKGSNEFPVYFDASGVATPISTISGISLPGAGVDFNGSISKFGKLVMITGTTASKQINMTIQDYIPEGYRPIQQAYGYAFGVNSTSDSAQPVGAGVVSINTSGSIRVSLVEQSTLYYIRFTIVYISQ